MGDLFPNAERAWHAEHHASLPKLRFSESDRRTHFQRPESPEHLVLSRVPEASEAIFLSGGLANTSVLLDSATVLRVYHRQTESIPLERMLLQLPWKNFQGPELLSQGSDFLLLEYVPHTPLENSQSHGYAAGKALAEIHSLRFDACGEIHSESPLHLAAENRVQCDWGCFPTKVQEYLDRYRDQNHHELLARCSDWFGRLRSGITIDCAKPSLLHGDFKASNLHWTKEGRILVLDWEFAYAGPGLMDIGQLFRWGASPDFRNGFAKGYQSAGASLPDRWESKSQSLDLVNLVGLLIKSPTGSRRENDCISRIEQTISDQPE